MPLNYQLKSGDIVEVPDREQGIRGPSRDWLKLVGTSRARNKIKAWFREENRETPSRRAATGRSAAQAGPAATRRSSGSRCWPM